MSDARPRSTLFALSKVEFMNVNYDANGLAFKALGRRGTGPRRRCRGIAGVLRFSGDPIPNRRTVDYRARSSGKRLLMIFHVGSACSDLGKGSRPVPELSVHYRRDFYACSACPGGMAIIAAERERVCVFLPLPLTRHFEAHVSI